MIKLQQQLKNDHKNARRRTDRSSALIKESLQRYGAGRSIVIDEENRILAGNGTIAGARAAGIKNVRVIETEGANDMQIKAAIASGETGLPTFVKALEKFSAKKGGTNLSMSEVDTLVEGAPFQQGSYRKI